MRCQFSIKQGTRGLPNTATIRITNQNPTVARQLAQAQAEYTAVSISAGYQGNSGLLFQGNIVKAIYGQENPIDTLTTILAADGGQAHDYAVVDQALAALVARVHSNWG